MRGRMSILAVVSAFAVFTATPAHLHGQQSVDPQQHDQHHPATEQAPPTAQQQPAAPAATMMNMMARMHANDAKLQELVKKMNAATGQAKTNATAELLTALVEDRQSNTEAMMANMMSMMTMMGGQGGRGGMAPATPATPATPKK